MFGSRVSRQGSSGCIANRLWKVLNIPFDTFPARRKEEEIGFVRAKIVVFPLNSLIHDQLQKINRIRTRAAVLTAGEQGLDLSLVDETRPKNTDYEFVFAHPETCLSSREGVSLFQSHACQSFVSAVIVDEAHCILEW